MKPSFFILFMLVWRCSCAEPIASTNMVAFIAKEIGIQVESSDLFPTDRPPTIRWIVKPAKAAREATSPTVGIAQIQFKGLTNSYCRLVASASASTSSFILVPVPEPANHDTCKGVRSFHSGDLNGDGAVDYWSVARVQSNRYLAHVGEVLVFLGRPEKPEPFCYSATASRAIHPANTSQAAATNAINNALKRTGQTTLGCDN